jgi:bifunctional enzyme CysN/CysC
MAAFNIGQEFPAAGREDMHIVIVGHVDHGKSTIIGRLLADTGSLPDGKLEFVKETCRRNAKPFEYAFLLDALKDEQAQGITIDVARCFFKTERRNYIIIDAPGHIEFLKNMVTGAARAEAAFLVIDATEGVKENSRRHGYMLSLLGIKQVAVLINKMDLVGYEQEVFDKIRAEYLTFLEQIGIEPCCFIPVSGMQGANIASKAESMPWYSGQTALEVLDGFEGETPAEEKPFRMPVQGVYKFTRDGDNRRIIAGTVEAGSLKVGDEVIFYPSGKTSRVKSIESFNEERKEQIGAGYATGFTLSEQIFVSRGELATVAGQTKPGVTSRVRANIFWLGKEPLRKEKEYLLKLGTARIGAYLEEVTRVIDAASLDVLEKDQVDKHDVAECIF